MNTELKPCPFCCGVLTLSKHNPSLALHPNNRCIISCMVVPVKDWNVRPISARTPSKAETSPARVVMEGRDYEEHVVPLIAERDALRAELEKAEKKGRDRFAAWIGKVASCGCGPGSFVTPCRACNLRRMFQEEFGTDPRAAISAQAEESR